MSKDRDGIEDDERLAPEVGDAAAEPTDLDPATAEHAEDDDAVDEADTAVADEDQTEAVDEAADTDVETAATEDDAADDAEPADDAATVGATPKAAVAGSNRAAARAASATRGATTTAGKDAPTRARDTVERPGFFARMGRFLREVVAELRKVIWPSRKQWATFTLVVIVFLVIMVALVSGMDVLFHLVVGKVFG